GEAMRRGRGFSKEKKRNRVCSKPRSGSNQIGPARRFGVAGHCSATCARPSDKVIPIKIGLADWRQHGTLSDVGVASVKGVGTETRHPISAKQLESSPSR